MRAALAVAAWCAALVGVDAGDGEQALSAVPAATRQLAAVIALRSIGSFPRVTGFGDGAARPLRGYV